MIFVGSISITLDSDWKQAEDTTNVEDVAAGERAMQVSKIVMAISVECGFFFINKLMNLAKENKYKNLYS